jgi:hypothetical protein
MTPRAVLFPHHWRRDVIFKSGVIIAAVAADRIM